MEGKNSVKCYHISPISNRQSIFQKGLLATDSRADWYKNRLCFSIDEKYMGFDYVSYQLVDVWSFYVAEEKMKLDEFADAPCFQYIEENIPPDQLVLEESIYL
jgi:hypothetical protein